MLLSTLLGGGMSSRLFQEIREKRGLVYSIYSFTAPAMDGGLFGIYAGTGEEEAKELVPVTLEELRRVQRDVNEAELRRARAQVKAGLLMSLESTGSRCEQLARQLQVFGRIVPIAETVAKIDAVTLGRRRRAAVRIFRGTPTLAAMGPAAHVPQLPPSPTGWPHERELDLARRPARPGPRGRGRRGRGGRCPATSRLGAAPARQDRASGALRRARPRPARVRRQALARPCRPPSVDPAGFARWPSAPWRWPRWCRRTRMAASPTRRGAADAAPLELDDRPSPTWTR